jgi:DNA-binding MarR family transcriptional regulator
MTLKEEFIKYVEEMMENSSVVMNEYAQKYWEALKVEASSDKPILTDDGKNILQYLREHSETTLWKSREIAEGLEISSRKVSGSMRKLVNDGFIEKIGKDPAIYTLTDNGKNIEIN